MSDSRFSRYVEFLDILNIEKVYSDLIDAKRVIDDVDEKSVFDLLAKIKPAKESLKKLSYLVAQYRNTRKSTISFVEITVRNVRKKEKQTSDGKLLLSGIRAASTGAGLIVTTGGAAAPVMLAMGVGVATNIRGQALTEDQQQYNEHALRQVEDITGKERADFQEMNACVQALNFDVPEAILALCKCANITYPPIDGHSAADKGWDKWFNTGNALIKGGTLVVFAAVTMGAVPAVSNLAFGVPTLMGGLLDFVILIEDRDKQPGSVLADNMEKAILKPLRDDFPEIKNIETGADEW